MKFAGGKRAATVCAAGALCLAALFAVACDSGTTSTQSDTGQQTYVVSIDKTGSDDGGDVYTITYSDGTTSQITMPGGEDGKDLTISDIWQAYVDESGEDITLTEFIEQYLPLSADSGTAAVSRGLLSSVSVYAEFVETTAVSGGFPGMGMGGITQSQIAQSGGSGVIYEIDENYVYIVTNYHVVYDSAADENKNGGDDTTQGVYAAQTGLTLEGRNAKYSLDSSGYGAIIEDVYITAVESGSLAEDLGLTAGDRLVAVTIKGTRHELTRSFELDELLLTARAGDEIAFTYERDGQTAETQSCTLSAEEHLEAA